MGDETDLRGGEDAAQSAGQVRLARELAAMLRRVAPRPAPEAPALDASELPVTRPRLTLPPNLNPEALIEATLSAPRPVEDALAAEPIAPDDVAPTVEQAAPIEVITENEPVEEITGSKPGALIEDALGWEPVRPLDAALEPGLAIPAGEPDGGEREPTGWGSEHWASAEPVVAMPDTTPSVAPALAAPVAPATELPPTSEAARIEAAPIVEALLAPEAAPIVEMKPESDALPVAEAEYVAETGPAPEAGPAIEPAPIDEGPLALEPFAPAEPAPTPPIEAVEAREPSFDMEPPDEAEPVMEIAPVIEAPVIETQEPGLGPVSGEAQEMGEAAAAAATPPPVVQMVEAPPAAEASVTVAAQPTVMMSPEIEASAVVEAPQRPAPPPWAFGPPAQPADLTPLTREARPPLELADAGDEERATRQRTPLVVSDRGAVFAIAAALAWLALVALPLTLSLAFGEPLNGLPLLGVVVWLIFLRVARWLSPPARADYLLRHGRYTEALAACDASLGVTGEGSWVGLRRLIWLNRRTSALLGLGRYDEALRAALTAMEQSPDPETIATCALALLRLNRYEDAIVAARLVSGVTHERSVRANTTLAMAMLARGLPVEADALASASLADIEALSPYVRRESHALCLAALVRALRAQKRLDGPNGARAALTRLRRLAGNDRAARAIALLEEAALLAETNGAQAQDEVERLARSARARAPGYTLWRLAQPGAPLTAMTGYLQDGLRAQAERAPSAAPVMELLRRAGEEMAPRPPQVSSSTALLAQIITVGATLALLALWTVMFFVFYAS